MHRLGFFIWMALGLSIFALSACGTSHRGSGDSGPPDAGPGANVQCGATTCGPGLVCCNASCGICAPPTGGCPAIECVDGGVPPPGCGTETCGAGELCCLGCNGSLSCFAGSVCPDLVCPPPACSSDGSVCAEGEYCDYPDDSCGGFGVCTPRPTACERDCPGVCGCNALEYCNACSAATDGVDVGDPSRCGSPTCAPMDAHGEGDCLIFLGYAWNGAVCDPISCMCVGTDCDRLYASYDECVRDHAGCTGGDCRATGCDPGSTCQVCAPDEWVCLLDGTVCAL